jgi:antitoxin (DNA-binding transcriptional repressor) of toxin-antitoxin stability system
VSSKEAEDAGTVVITRHGRPVAVLGPFRLDHGADREGAITRIVALMREGVAIGGRRFSRH